MLDSRMLISQEKDLNEFPFPPNDKSTILFCLSCRAERDRYYRFTPLQASCIFRFISCYEA